MKKWVFGCLALFIVVAVAGGFGAYYFIYKPAREYYRATVAKMKVVPDLNAQVANKAAFTPPADGLLNQNSVERFVRAQQTVQTRMGARLKELGTKYRSLSGPEGPAKHPSPTEVLSALKDITGLYVDAKRAQVDALNAEGLSLAEYEWTRGRVYEALGLPIDTTVQHAIRDLSAGKMPDIESITKAPSVPVPEKNKELVQPFTQQLTESAALAFFAL